MRHTARTVLCLAAICRLAESDMVRPTSIVASDEPCKYPSCNENLDGAAILLCADRGLCCQPSVSPGDIFTTTTSNLPPTQKLVGTGAQEYSNTELLLQAALDGDTEVVQKLVAAGADLASYRHQTKSVYEEPARREKVRYIILPHTDYERDALEGTAALHLAAYGGHIEVVKFLIHAGADVSAFDYPGLTALHWATYKGHKDIVALLLENGANPSSVPHHLTDILRNPTEKGSMGLTAMLRRTDDDDSLLFGKESPLHWAVAGGHEDVVQQLLDSGADLHMEGLGSRHTALERAADRGNDKLIRMLIHAGAPASQKALKLAVLSEHIEAARLLLETGADASLPDIYGLRPLNLAASKGYETIARLLLEAGADVDSVDATGASAIHLAAAGGHDTVLQLLINAGANTTSTDENGMRPLHHASQGGNLKAVQLLLGNTSVSHPDLNEATALHRAASCGNVEVFSLLLNTFEDTDALSTPGTMPIYHLSFGDLARKPVDHTGPVLHHAAYGGSQQIVSILLARGVDITATDNYGMTALHWAVQNGRTAVAAATIQQLLDAGADASTLDNCGRTALSWASFPPRVEAIELLCQAGGAPLYYTSMGPVGCGDATIAPEIASAHMKNLTPLHLAARDGKSIEIGNFIEEGIDLSFPDGSGMTALHWAARGGHVIVLQQLLAAGADTFALDKCGRSALQWAAEERQYGAVVLLAKEQLDACQKPDVSCPTELVSLLRYFTCKGHLVFDF